MRMLYAVIGIVLVGTFIFYLVTRKNKSTENKQSITKQNADTGKIRETKVQENFYPELRNKSLTVTPEDLHLKFDSDKTIVYGVVMDWDIGQAIVTVISFQTGDASLYISTGQIFIGGYSHENVRNASLAFVSEAQNYLSIAKLTNNISLPDKGFIRFYLLTNKGTFTFQEPAKNITSNNSVWTKLFYLGNKVVAEYRTTTEK